MKPFFTRKEVSNYVGCTYRTVLNWIKRGRVKVDGAGYIAFSNVEAMRIDFNNEVKQRIEHQRARRVKSQADIAELQLGRIKGVLLNSTEVYNAFATLEEYSVSVIASLKPKLNWHLNLDDTQNKDLEDVIQKTVGSVREKFLNEVYQIIENAKKTTKPT